MSVLDSMKGGLIVSCQAPEGSPFQGACFMAEFAIAAKRGGAVGIRANRPENVRAVKEATGLPVIGIWKIRNPRFEIYITPTLESLLAVAEAGAEIVALDATPRARHDGLSLAETIREAKAKVAGLLLMADISNYEEGMAAEAAGVDIVATTMSGYTPYTEKTPGPDFELIRRLAEGLSVPLICEGRVQTPEDARRALDLGAFAVVVGGAITRPDVITERFVEGIGRK